MGLSNNWDESDKMRARLEHNFNIEIAKHQQKDAAAENR